MKLQTTLQRLDPVKDESLYREACAWDATYPSWYQDCKSFFGLDDFERLYLHMFDEVAVAVAVFDKGEYTALLDLQHRGGGMLEVQVYAKRHTSLTALIQACCSLKTLLDCGVKELYAFIATINKPMIKVCEMAGMKRDGVRILQAIPSRVIQWERFRFDAEIRQQEVAA